jgi:hypothetical protein
MTPAAALYDRVNSVIPPIEWPVFGPDVEAIQQLKRERRGASLAGLMTALHLAPEPVVVFAKAPGNHCDRGFAADREPRQPISN